MLRTVKVLHTVIWAFVAGCVVATPVAAWRGDTHLAWLLIAVVSAEVAVLAINGWRCPLTDVAGRYTDDRADNFDIYLPRWLARHNKTIFGSLYVAGVLLAIVRGLG